MLAFQRHDADVLRQQRLGQGHLSYLCSIVLPCMTTAAAPACRKRCTTLGALIFLSDSPGVHVMHTQCTHNTNTQENMRTHIHTYVCVVKVMLAAHLQEREMCVTVRDVHTPVCCGAQNQTQPAHESS